MNGGEPSAAAAQALRLLAGVQEWVRHDLGSHLATAPHLAGGAPQCRYCPLCAAIAVLRGDRPEVTEKLVAAGSALLTAVRAAFEPVPGWPGGGPGDPATGDPAAHRDDQQRAGHRPGHTAGAGRRAGHAAGSRVERIDLD